MAVAPTVPIPMLLARKEDLNRQETSFGQVLKASENALFSMKVPKIAATTTMTTTPPPDNSKER